ncbi:MAG: response regulator, partial [Synergistaceae bacterium]|nr:response regulator [Synergistaceae bacterium]
MNGETTAKKRILVVDDVADNLWLLGSILRDYTIMIARNGPAALELAHRTPPPDMILLDILMPDMDGCEVCRRLKENPATRDIPVIFITSRQESRDEEKGLELGAVDYITKPVIPSLVRARVRTHLELKQHRDDLDALVRERTRKLELTQRFSINALATLAEWRDSDTGEHIYRTREYVRLLMNDLRKQAKFALFLTPQVMEILCWVAPLHDIGKVCVPDSILLKPEALTPEEFEIMKQHPVFARKALESAGEELENHVFLCLARDVACSHHEKWDGTGYPAGLAGEDIPIGARIMALADVYDALSSARVYKGAFCREKTAGL